MRMIWRFLTVGITLSLPLFAIGCLSSPPDGGGGGTNPAKDTPDEAPPSAFFTLTAAEIRDPGWPEAWADYDVFVCTAFLPAETVAQARADRPDATFLAYTAVSDLYNGNPENPYFAAFHAVFDTTLYVRDLDTDTVVRLYGSDGTPGSGHGYFVIQQPSADVLVAFHRDVTIAAGFHGLYLDNCNAEMPQWRRDRLAEIPRLDIDGDGLADPHHTIPDVYATWRPYYTQQLRAALGPDVLLVANSGGPLDDAPLNGITLEGVGDRFDVSDALSYFDSQRSVGHAPFVAVAWVTTVASDEPTREIVPAVPGLHYGFIDRN